MGGGAGADDYTFIVLVGCGELERENLRMNILATLVCAILRAVVVAVVESGCGEVEVE